MYFDPKILAANFAGHRPMAAHWAALWESRNLFNNSQIAMIEQNRGVMTPETLAANAVQGIAQSAWAEIDSQVIQMRDQEIGMEIVTDLMGVQTVLNVGKTAKLYNVVGDIADDVSVSIDGQAPFSFDHTEYASDGDPIPVFSAGYGVNWRHAAGLSTVGIDLILDSQAAKLRKFNQRIVNYMLNGDSHIQVESYPAQGLKNHRNTVKINLGAGAGGANINLATATADQLIAFFTTGAFGTARIANRVARYDVMWVSPQIWANLSKAYYVNGVLAGTVLAAIKAFLPAADVRETYALSGNELLAYVRRRDVVSPLVGMTTGVTPLPRPMPNVNYNFQILAALGLQVTRDDQGLSGVVYAGVLVP